MVKRNFLLQITNSIWLIEPSAITNLGPVIRNLLERNPTAFNAEEKKPQVQIFDPQSAAVLPGYYSGFASAPKGSVAIIDVCGVLMKEDNCGDPGTASLGALAKEADANPNIIATIFRFDTPGGSVSGTEDFSNTIKNMQKPTIGFVSGMMCSAGYWAGSACDELYISGKTDMVGSIGTMMSFADAQPMFEKQGVVFHEIYADQSIDKNAESAAARQGNYDLVKKNILNPMNNAFTSAVKANRGDKLNQEETLSGKVFLGSKSIKMGLVDGMKTFDETIAQAQKLSNQSINNNNQNQPNMKIKAGFTAVIAFLATAFSGFKADETVLTEEHLEKINAELATLDAVKTEKETAAAALVTATTEKTTAEIALATANAEIVTLKAKVVELGAANPGATATVSDANAKEPAAWEEELSKLEHNQAVDKSPIFTKVEKMDAIKK